MFLAFVEEDCWKEVRAELDTINVIEDEDKIGEILRDDPGKNCVFTNSAIVFNLGSAINTGYRLTALTTNRANRIPVFNYSMSDYMVSPFPNNIPTPMVTEEMLTRGFDVTYAQTIESDQDVFAQLFSIIYALYNGADCYILVGSNNSYKQMITDSLMKYIQQRYEISPIAYIACLEDYFSYEKKANFSLTGVYNIDSDINRYVYAVVDFNKIARESND